MSSPEDSEVVNVEMDSIEKNIDILSFDGGGSRGVMEVKILDDVLRLATIVLRNPLTVHYLVNEECNERKKHFLENLVVRERLINDMNAVKDPLHPADVYDMIVGTSTGALVAFGLVGGKRVGKYHHIRERMSVDECIQMYLTKTKIIFKKTLMQKFLSCIPMLSSIPLGTYSQANVKKVVKKQFSDCSLEDFRKLHDSKCVAGAVARRLGRYEDLVLFDTANEDYKNYKAYKVLLASSNAPIYFDTPVKIGNDEFVDGGVGANCPLRQAIPRAQTVFAKDGKQVKIVSVLSIAPPSSSKSEIPSHGGLSSWLYYFVNASTDGYAVFNDLVEKNRGNKTLFQRLSPRGKSLKKFKLDEINVQNMIDAMDDEKLHNDMFLVDVVASAMLVVLASIDKGQHYQKISPEIASQLAQAAGLAHQSKREYESAIISYKTSKRLLQRKVRVDEQDDFTMMKITYNIAKCTKKQGNFQLAIYLLKTSVRDLLCYQGDPKSDLLLVDSLIEIADIYMETFRYDDAETYLNEVIVNYIKEKQKFARILIYEGWCKQQLGKYDEAVNLYREAATYTADDVNPEKAEILNNIGLCFLSLGMIEKALTFVLLAQDVRDKLSKEKNDPLVAESYFNVGFCLLKKGDFDAAKKNLEDAKAIYEYIGDKIGVSLILRNLARYLTLKNPPDNDLALVYAQQAQEKMKKYVLDYDNPGIAVNLSVLGLCLFNAERFEEAKMNLLEALDMIENLFSENHPWLIEIYQLLYDIFVRYGDLAKAENYKRKRARIYSEINKMAKNIDTTSEVRWKSLPYHPFSINSRSSF
ncbi:uncharacterized protein LOC124434458 [Xenia sp. Carnegie-2017]|uniref:uncharacterized protein LOC124434458 n=1 Tax=Xenia sp. Carnegie-2017 TaxID=2897299 RepID=UPI001F04B7D2|nr:uncharacterized protein LOC124434458 [Xenia sp. Carnegie-2017]